MSDNVSRECVYTILGRVAIQGALTNGGGGEFVEGRRWAHASRHLAARASRDLYPLLLGDAATTAGVEWVARLESIELLEDGGSRVRFRSLAALPKVIPLHDLRKVSDDQPLSDSYIRPYVPCRLPPRAERQVSQAIREADDRFSKQVLAEVPPAREKLQSDVAAREIDADPKSAGISATTREALIDARIGQGGYRARMLALWDGRCAVTGCAIPQVLIASHAKPWADSSNDERLDAYNGLLLAAHVDRLFDAGLIAFADDGNMLLSPQVSPAALRSVGLSTDARLRTVDARHKPYLAAHRAKFGFNP